MFEFDEFAAIAPEWYEAVVKALEDCDNDLAKRLAQEVLDKHRDAASCLAVAIACLAISDVDQARRLADEASSLASTDTKAKAAAEHLLAKILVQQGRTSEAELPLSAAMEAYIEVKDETGRAAVLTTRSKCKKDSGEAFEALNEALSIFKQLKNTKGSASVIYAMLTRKLSMGLTDQASLMADQLVALFELTADEVGAATARLTAGQVCLAAGNVQDAVLLVKRAAESFGHLGKAKKKAGAVNTLANVLRIGGMYQDAHKAATAALTLCRELGDKRGQAAALCMEATISDAEKDHGKAAYKLERAAKLYKQLKDGKEEAQTLESTASMQLKVFWMLDDPKEPERLCRKAMALYASLGMENGPECAYLLQTLAFALLAQGRKEAALEQAELSVGNFQALGNANGEAAAYNKMAQIYWSLQQKDDAVKMASKGVRIAVDCGDTEEAAWGNQLIQQYTGGKPIGHEDEGQLRKSGKFAPKHQTETQQNIFMYVYGRDYCHFTGGEWRGAPAAPMAKKAPAPMLEEVEVVQETSLHTSIDWQSMGTL